LKVESLKLKVEENWNIVQSDGGYRFWPDKVKGEGFFIACFRKTGDNDEEIYLRKIKPEKFSVKEMEILNKNVNAADLAFLRHEEIIYAVPEKLLADISFLSSKLRVVNCGTRIGEIIKDKLIPDHGLALSSIISEKIQKLELDQEQAIQYLKKKEIRLETDKRGWTLVTHQGHPLGWINILPNRINNYYPKELRILKD
jgi:NOL1/NOP2/fmu family ribosome biogenesis protein